MEVLKLQNPILKYNKFTISTLLFLCIILSLFIFWPALSGPFLFDDFPNLKEMGNHGGITDIQSLLAFTLSFDGSPLGRPISMLSFALNDQYWPAVPWGFKYTNLLLHILNGILVFVLTKQLSQLVLKNSYKAEWISLVTMTLWLLHPIQLSTMMLVIQRMTQIMAMFTLLGLIGFVYGRQIIVNNKIKGYVCISASIGIGTLLAVLSKENGILILLYALVIETTIIKATKIENPRYWKIWMAVFLILPLLIVMLIICDPERISRSYIRRDFTLEERLLTQPRILLDYLSMIFIPRIGGSGLFHDDFQYSKGILQPVSTLICICIILFFFVFALAKRNKFPIVAFSILWFLSGHVIESSFLGLELYFEHRNYLPLIGPIFALSYYLLSCSNSLKKITVSMTCIFILILSFLSYQSSIIWGNEAKLSQIWATENPTSVRAQQLAAKYWSSQGNYQAAKSHLEYAVQYNPEDIGLYFQILLVNCYLKIPVDDNINDIKKRIIKSKYSNSSLEVITQLRKKLATEKCYPLTYKDLNELIYLALKNPKFNSNSSTVQYLLYERGRIGIDTRNLNLAMNSFDKAYEARPNVDIALLQVQLLLSAGLYEEALNYIEIAKNNTQNSFKKYFLSKAQDIDIIESIIHEKLNRQIDIN